MKAISNLLMTLPLLLGTIGCVSSYKHVLVSVVDSTTHEPVEGAKITTSYAGHSGFLLVSPHPFEAVTDKNGMALLLASFSAISPDYQVHVLNDKYRVDLTAIGRWDDDKPLRARSKASIPTTPDILVTVPNRAEWEKQRAEAEKQGKLDEQQAEDLFEKSPDYWPEHRAGGSPVIKDKVGDLLLSKRWQSASKKPLGTKADIASIRAAVIRHMKMPKTKVNEIGWLSSSLVMVSSSWYEGPLAAAGYTYVLQKGKDGWIVLAYYMDWVS
jgi:hypothetical protein